MQALIFFSFLHTLSFLCSLLLYLILRDLYVFNSDGLISQPIFFDACIGLLVEFFVVPADCLILFSFVGVEDVLGKVAIVGNSSDLVAVDVFAYQLFSVFDRPLFSGVDGSCWSPGNALPQSNVHVF